MRTYFSQAGYEITKLHSFNIDTPVRIAHVSRDQLREAILDIDRTGPDSIVQVGTGFIMGALAAEAEEWLGKPVIAINTAWYWRALRACGISDRIDGFGHLLARY